jgi:hypothetical protein
MTVQLWLAFAFGAVFVIGLFTIATLIWIFDKPLPPDAMFIFRVILGIAAAGIGAVLPGVITLGINASAQFALQAGGALALFVLVYLVNPPKQFASSASRALDPPTDLLAPEDKATATSVHDTTKSHYEDIDKKLNDILK